MNVQVDGVMLVLILSNLIVLGSSQLRTCIRCVALQGIVLGVLPFLAQHNGQVVSTLFLCTVTIGLKGIVFPRLLIRAIRDAEVRREVEPYVGYTISILVGLIALSVSAWLSSRLPVFGRTFSSLVVPVAFFMIFVGLFITVSRRNAVNQILGYLVLENGTYIFGVVMFGDMPLLVELGVLLDAFVAVFVMGLAVFHIQRQFDSLDVDHLDTLKG